MRMLKEDRFSSRHNPKVDTLLTWIDRQHDSIVGIQRELVARPAVNPEYGGSGEIAKLNWVEKRLREYGLTDLVRMDYADARVDGKVRGNLIAKFPGHPKTLIDNSIQRRTLWLISHLDVFPPGPADKWKGDPFTLRVEGDLMYGRGVEDNHQSIVSSLLLVEAFKATGTEPELDIGLVFCSGALTNYTMNIKHILKRKPELFSQKDLILVMDYGRIDGARIEVAEKVNVWLKFTVTGCEGHAASPQESVNALVVAAAFIHALRESGAVFPVQNPIFEPPGCTFSPTLTENYSKAANHIPGEFVFYVDVRLIPEYGFENLEKAMRDLSETVGSREGARIDFEVIEQTPPAPATSIDAPIVHLLSRAVKNQLGVDPEPVGIGGVTMASAIREHGFPVAVWAIQQNWRNKAEEHSSIANHISQTKVLARLLLDPEAAEVKKSEQSAWSKLTRREREVAELIIQEKSNMEICAALFISDNTLRTHIKNINHKTGATNREELKTILRENENSVP